MQCNILSKRRKDFRDCDNSHFKNYLPIIKMNVTKIISGMFIGIYFKSVKQKDNKDMAVFTWITYL